MRRATIDPAGACRRASLLFLVTAVFSTGLWVQPASSAGVAAPGHRLWAARYDGPAGGNDSAQSVAVSPDGTTVYVTGASDHGTSVYDDFATVAYDASTGAEIWAQRYDGPKSDTDIAREIAVSPDGATVFVTGYSFGGVHSYSDYATIAYDAATGDQIWVERFDAHGGYDDVYALAVSPNGTEVFVTGSMSSGVISPDYDYGTVAYDAATGTRLWVKRYDNSPGTESDIPYDVDVSPDGTHVYVTGTSYGNEDTYSDYATVSYDAVTGAEQWVQRYDGPGTYEDIAYAIGVSPDGTKVFVTGQSYAYPTNDYGTIAYDTSTGTELWHQRYDGVSKGYDEAYALAVSPDGSRVVVTGASYGGGAENDDYETVVYDAATGLGMWQHRYDGPGKDDDVARAVAVSPDGTQVYVTGTGNGGFYRGYTNYATIAYDLATGSTLWIKSVDDRANGGDDANDLAVAPDGTALFVTGSSFGNDSTDYATVAYATS